MSIPSILPIKSILPIMPILPILPIFITNFTLNSKLSIENSKTKITIIFRNVKNYQFFFPKTAYFSHNL